MLRKRVDGCKGGERVENDGQRCGKIVGVFAAVQLGRKQLELRRPSGAVQSEALLPSSGAHPSAFSARRDANYASYASYASDAAQAGLCSRRKERRATLTPEPTVRAYAAQAGDHLTFAALRKTVAYMSVALPSCPSIMVSDQHSTQQSELGARGILAGETASS